MMQEKVFDFALGKAGEQNQRNAGHGPNENRDKPRHRVVANTLNASRSGAVGFIDWLEVQPRRTKRRHALKKPREIPNKVIAANA